MARCFKESAQLQIKLGVAEAPKEGEEAPPRYSLRTFMIDFKNQEDMMQLVECIERNQIISNGVQREEGKPISL